MTTIVTDRWVTRRKSRSIRKTSRMRVLGIPLWQVARGPDRARGESHGHARAVLAAGDEADGVVAVGGVARGVFAVGGVAIGVFALGGLSISLVAGLGGAAISALRAIGGVAIAPRGRGAAVICRERWGPFR
jgi:hypothetical protein